MEKQTRRTFVASAIGIGASVAANALPLPPKKNKKMLTHHVFFWLKNPSSKEDLEKLLEGLRTLEKIETVKGIYIGVPASTEQRGVVDHTYQASELLFFENVEGQNVYQDHPIHQKFVENYSHLWDKVIVYDSIGV